MSDLPPYADQFEHVVMRREDGILELRLHTDGGPLQWGLQPHEELGHVFRAVARDKDNRVVIVTGTGDAFSGPRASESDTKAVHSMPASAWDHVHADGMELIDALLSIQAPVIGAINGPAFRHCELPLLSDIVLCTEDTEFQDSAHFPDGLTPGDGINVLTPLVMGLTRSRYFHLTGQVIDARTALDWGMVNEVLPAGRLGDRAWELARQLARQKTMVLRHTRLLFTHQLRRQMLEMVGYGLALEGMDVADAHVHAHREG